MRPKRSSTEQPRRPSPARRTAVRAGDDRAPGPSSEAPAPHGREAVKTALLDSAAALFAERGPGAVSVREVAIQAGVNHGLVHRHFGSKEALVAGVLERMAGEIARAVPAESVDAAAIEALFSAAASRASYWRILAWALLAGESPSALQAEFPTVHRLVDAYRAQQRAGALAAGVDPAVMAGASVALVLGWLLFEPFLLEATGLARRGAAAGRSAVVAHLAAFGALLDRGRAGAAAAPARQRAARRRVGGSKHGTGSKGSKGKDTK